VWLPQTLQQRVGLLVTHLHHVDARRLALQLVSDRLERARRVDTGRVPVVVMTRTAAAQVSLPAMTSVSDPCRFTVDIPRRPLL
jgi:hypothetical protein